MATLTPFALQHTPALIESVFPAQKVSFESQRECKAGAGQTLTALGFYWKGRKPLILVRAIVLGSLLPTTDDAEDAEKDLEIYEQLLALDNPWHYFICPFKEDELSVEEAYSETRAFGKVLGKRGGFMKNLMQQRICSSIVAGINTATALLAGRTLHEESDDMEEDVALQTVEERAVLELLLHRLKKIDIDPKCEAVLHYLVNEGWLQLGVSFLVSITTPPVGLLIH